MYIAPSNSTRRTIKSFWRTGLVWLLVPPFFRDSATDFACLGCWNKPISNHKSKFGGKKRSSSGFFSSFRHVFTRFWVWFSVKSYGTSRQRLLTFPTVLRCRITYVCGISRSADNLRVLVDEFVSSLRSVCPLLNFLNYFCVVLIEMTSFPSTLHIFFAASVVLNSCFQ